MNDAAVVGLALVGLIMLVFGGISYTFKERHENGKWQLFIVGLGVLHVLPAITKLWLTAIVG